MTAAAADDASRLAREPGLALVYVNRRGRQAAEHHRLRAEQRLRVRAADEAQLLTEIRRSTATVATITRLIGFPSAVAPAAPRYVVSPICSYDAALASRQ